MCFDNRGVFSPAPTASGARAASPGRRAVPTCVRCAAWMCCACGRSVWRSKHVWPTALRAETESTERRQVHANVKVASSTFACSSPREVMPAYSWSRTGNSETMPTMFLHGGCEHTPFFALPAHSLQSGPRSIRGPRVRSPLRTCSCRRVSARSCLGAVNQGLESFRAGQSIFGVLEKVFSGAYNSMFQRLLDATRTKYNTRKHN